MSNTHSAEPAVSGMQAASSTQGGRGIHCVPFHGSRCEINLNILLEIRIMFGFLFLHIPSGPNIRYDGQRQETVIKELNETKLEMEAEPRNHPYFVAPSKSVCSAYDSIRTRSSTALFIALGFSARFLVINVRSDTIPRKYARIKENKRIRNKRK
jgi:hypothetical protein